MLFRRASERFNVALVPWSPEDGYSSLEDYYELPVEMIMELGGEGVFELPWIKRNLVRDTISTQAWLDKILPRKRGESFDNISLDGWNDTVARMEQDDGNVFV